MITKQINIEGIEQNRYDVLVLLADNSLRGELHTVDEEGNEVGERLHNAVFVEPWPFELTKEEFAVFELKDETAKTPETDIS